MIDKKFTPQKEAPVFDIREVSLLPHFRSRDDVRERREAFLIQGIHWDYVNKRVMLSQAGAQLLVQVKDVALPQKKNVGAGGANAAHPVALLGPVPFKGKVIVWAVPKRNPRLVSAYLPGTDPTNPLNVVSVLVKENFNFLPGMEIPVHHIEHNSYELVGQCPRWRGRF